MKISVQSQLLVMSCFIASVCSFAIIGWQFSHTSALQKQMAQVELEHVQIKHLQSMLSQWMTTIDLFFTNQQSYLVTGIEQQSIQLNEKLSNIQFSRIDLDNALIRMSGNIETITDNVNRAASSGPSNDNQWLTFIDSVDSVTNDIINDYGQLQQGMSDLANRVKEELAAQQQDMAWSFIISISLTVGILALLGTWNSRQIIKPLMRLSDVADQDKQEDVQGISINSNAGIPAELVIIEQRLKESFIKLAKGKRKAERDHEKIEQQNWVLQDTIKRLEATRQQLVQSEKLASIGQLANGVAHEINNPIGYVLSNLQTLGDYTEAQRRYIEATTDAEKSQQGVADAYQVNDIDFIVSDIPDLIESVLDGLHRVKSIVKDLRVFSEMGEEPQSQVSIHHIVEQALATAKDSFPAELKITQDLAYAPLFTGAQNTLVQVFVNLLLNASDATKDGGEVHVSVTYDEDKQLIHTRVEDTGCGIKDEHMRLVFDPFFTSKPVGQGIGLGLHICHSVVKNHCGRIDVSSDEGKGSIFKVTLPVQQACVDEYSI